MSQDQYHINSSSYLYIKVLATAAYGSHILAFLDLKSVASVRGINKQITIEVDIFLKESKNEQNRYKKSIQAEWNRLAPLVAEKRGEVKYGQERNSIKDGDFKIYFRINKYLKCFDHLTSNKMQRDEMIKQNQKQDFDQMATRSSFLKMASHNIITIILSFLEYKKILQTRIICKAFFNSYLSSQKIIVQQYKQMIETRNNYINSYLSSEELKEMVKFNQSYKLNKMSVKQLKSYYRFPECGRILYQFILNLEENEPLNLEGWNIVMKSAKFNDKQIQICNGMLSNCYYQELDQIKKDKIEKFKVQYSFNSFDELQKISTIFGILYSNIIINYHLQTSNIPLEVYQKLIKSMNWIQKINKLTRKMNQIIIFFEKKKL